MKEEEIEEKLAPLLLLKRRLDDVPDRLDVFTSFRLRKYFFFKSVNKLYAVEHKRGIIFWYIFVSLIQKQSSEVVS